MVFYGGSTVVALNNDRYHDFFVESVPLGESIIDNAEANGWDRALRGGAARQVVDAGRITAGHLQDVVNRTIGSGNDSTPKSAPTKAGQAAPPGSKVAAVSPEKKEEVKEKARAAVQSAVTKVKDDTAKVQEKTAEVAQTVKEDAKAAEVKLSEGVKELVAEAEAALASKSSEEVNLPPGTKLYTGYLPIGHTPPPGYALPGPKKAAKSADSAAKAPAEEAKPAPPPLPLVAPAVSKVAASEPVIAQLAESIDNLAGFLKDNPSAISGNAKDVLHSAEVDLVQLADRIEQVRQDEHKKLEDRLDEQAKEYNLRLLEMEADAQDKIDRQEEDWKQLFEDERNKIISGYRAKLQRELETQQEIINERYRYSLFTPPDLWLTTSTLVLNSTG